MPHLPDELLFQITKDLIGIPGETTTLANICLASRSLYAFAQPFLYRKFVKSHRDIIAAETSTSRSLTRLEVFLRTLIKRPDLASLVETLTLTEFQNDDISLDSDSDGEESLPLDSGLADMFQKAALDVPEKEDENQWMTSWRAELRDGNPDAEAALLLTLVPNLRCLDITSSVGSLGVYVEDLCRQCLGPQIKYTNGQNYFYKDFLSQRSAPSPFFSKLETLNLRGTGPVTGQEVDEDVDDDGNDDDDEMTLQLASCVNLMTVPTIESFSAYRVGEEDTYLDMELDTFRVPLSHIRHLKFDDCVIHDNVYRTLMNSCSELKSLEISFGCSNIIVSEDFLETLQGLSKTLERLALVTPRSYKSIEYATPCDLRILHNLKSLEMEATLLVPDEDISYVLNDLIPASLEKLSIRRCDLSIKSHLKSLISNIGTLSNLREVEIGVLKDEDLSWGSTDDEEEGFKAFLEEHKRSFENEGVRLLVLKD